MTKATMVCPFSKGKCVECGIFRGRHLGFCSKPKPEGPGEKGTQAEAFPARRPNVTWEVPPEFALGNGCIKDVEDCHPGSSGKKPGYKSHETFPPKGGDRG
ncbi:MAG TPA: hypothetical protein DCR97_08890 [Deltaproteobacteria bacterium]|nr:hypothetical protein [Deltaproteobacteria bacterium]